MQRGNEGDATDNAFTLRSVARNSSEVGRGELDKTEQWTLRGK